MVKDKKGKVRRNRYLDELGLEPSVYGVNIGPDCEDMKVLRRWKDQRADYGFDERETYELDRTFAEWLYCHLMMYRQKASKVIDLKYYAVDFEGRIYTQKEALDRMIDWTGYYLKHRDDNKKSEKAYIKLQRASMLWALILPHMGW